MKLRYDLYWVASNMKLLCTVGIRTIYHLIQYKPLNFVITKMHDLPPFRIYLQIKFIEKSEEKV